MTTPDQILNNPDVDKRTAEKIISYEELLFGPFVTDEMLEMLKREVEDNE